MSRQSSPRDAIACVLFAAGDICGAVARAQSTTFQLYPLQTLTSTNEQFLTGSKDALPAVIGGELRIPAAPGHIPAVVILHGGIGVGEHEDFWARELNRMGVAVFIVDSFTGRAVEGSRANVTQIPALASLDDAYRALDMLAKHPRVDPLRIAVLGFSRGAVAAIYASMRRFQAGHGTPGVEFAAYLGFYTPCITTYIDDEDVSDRPIRRFHGVADDTVPIEACRQYVERLRKAGKDATLTEYPGAYHRFDDRDLPIATFQPLAQSFRRCSLEERPAGKVISLATGASFTPADPCIERGATVALNDAAQRASLIAVKTFLTQVFPLPR